MADIEDGTSSRDGWTAPGAATGAARPMWAPPSITDPPAPGIPPPPPEPGPPHRRGPSTGAIVTMALVGVIAVLGLLIGAVLLLGSSSETRFVTVGESIEGSSAPSRSEHSDSDQRSAEPEQAGLLLSETDLARVPGLTGHELDLDHSEASTNQEVKPYCDDASYTAAQTIEERWGGSGWEIDVSVASAETAEVARRRVLDRQGPAFFSCVASQYGAKGPWRLGTMDGEVVDHEETATDDGLTSNVLVEGHMDDCAGTMAVAFRQAGAATVSVRMFGCARERFGVDPAFGIEDADRLAATVAERIGGRAAAPPRTPGGPIAGARYAGPAVHHHVTVAGSLTRG